MASIPERIQAAMEHKQLGNFEDAAATLQSVLAEEPGYAEGHHQLGLAYVFLGRLEESLEHLELAFALYPSSPTYRRDLGKTYVMAGEYEKAEPFLKPEDGPGDSASGAGTPSPLLPVSPLRAAGNARPFPPEEL